MTRILINPDSLRATARTLNETASEYGLLARAIGSEDINCLAPDIRGLVDSSTQRARGQLVAVSSELAQEANTLRRRADIADADLRRAWRGATLVTLMRSEAAISVGQNMWWGMFTLSQAELSDMYATVQGTLGVAGDVDFGTTLAGLLLSSGQSRGGFAKALRGSSVRGVGPLAIINSMWDAAKVGGALASGDWSSALWSTKSLGFDLLSVASRRASIYTAAFMFGWDTGMMLDRQFQIGGRTSSFVMNQTIAARYDGKTAGELTPSEADEYSRRYSGVLGPVHFSQDLIGSPAQKAKRFLGGIF